MDHSSVVPAGQVPTEVKRTIAGLLVILAARAAPDRTGAVVGEERSEAPGLGALVPGLVLAFL